MNPRMNFDQASKGIPMLKDKVAIVTGSTSGIGLGIAEELAKLGADLVLNGFGDASEIEAIRKGIERDHGVRAVYDGADMSKAEAVRGLIAATVEKFGRLDILVNNAGIQFRAVAVASTMPRSYSPSTTAGAVIGSLEGLPSPGRTKASELGGQRPDNLRGKFLNAFLTASRSELRERKLRSRL